MTKAELIAIVARLEAEKAQLFDLTCTQQTQIARLMRDYASCQQANEYLFTTNRALANLNETLAATNVELHARIEYLVNRYVPKDDPDPRADPGAPQRA